MADTLYNFFFSGVSKEMGLKYVSFETNSKVCNKTQIDKGGER